jgi:cell wall-associated NlpC family hydrolase
MTQIPSAGYQYCSAPFALTAGSSCLLKVSIDSTLTSGNIQGGPKVCYTSGHPVYCSQPLAVDQLNTQIIAGAVPQSCQENVANFDYALTQTFDNSSFTTGWGPARNCLLMSPSNPNLASCPTSDAAGVAWQQQRIIAAADFWVKKKLSYCHHYLPDFNTLAVSRGATQTMGGYCNPAVDLYPGTPYYNQQARWNYSGTGSETIDNWVNNNYMWYGFDCSDYTAFIYDFAFGTVFDSDTGYQAGQASAGQVCPGPSSSCQDSLSPNIQTTSTPNFILNNPNAAGTLLCADGTLDQGNNTFCSGHGNSHGNYVSMIDKFGQLEPSGTITANFLSTILQPGDLIFIAGGGVTRSPTTSEVTHVVVWTGKQVGYGTNDINPSQIAPDDIPGCTEADWGPVVGDWVITDSHYQGADYRVLSLCFYLNNIWGVRRVIPVSVYGPKTPNVNCSV